jgi:hypothetical protein
VKFHLAYSVHVSIENWNTLISTLLTRCFRVVHGLNIKGCIIHYCGMLSTINICKQIVNVLILLLIINSCMFECRCFVFLTELKSAVVFNRKGILYQICSFKSSSSCSESAFWYVKKKKPKEKAKFVLLVFILLIPVITTCK